MSAHLSPKDFATFFEEVHGCDPFPWQRRLAASVAETGEWPEVLDLPTGSGKTAVLDIAVFHLALEAELGSERSAPVRIVLAVDRRLVVDDAFERARKIAKTLLAPPGRVTELVALRLRRLAGTHDPLVVRRLRGGIPREDDWARTPVQPTILCSTVDQIGSRLLFRGYGVSDRAKPIHAGLLGSDCRIMLDEAHLAEPFRQTLGWIKLYRGRKWHADDCATGPWGVTLLTATPGHEPAKPFVLESEDYAHPVLSARWLASKPTRLVELSKAKNTMEATESDDRVEIAAEAEHKQRVAAIVNEVLRGLDTFAKDGIPDPAIGVVVNRVGRARDVYEALKASQVEIGEPLLMIGPARPIDRAEIAEQLDPIRTRTWGPGEVRHLRKPMVLVATQCLEAGVDIDLDGLITEAAPLDALRQRFGRLNRSGRAITPYAAIIAAKSDLSSRTEDPVYGEAIRNSWSYLIESTDPPIKKATTRTIDFGLAAFQALTDLRPISGDALSPKPCGPVLLPAHLDLLSQTSPIPSADPEVGLFLHGPNRQPTSVTLVWRADIQPSRDARNLLLLVPPRSAEAIELPVWAVRRWLEAGQAGLDQLADVATSPPDDEDGTRLQPRRTRRLVFRWAGDVDRSDWIAPSAIRPGDTVVVPAAYGGVDAYGWNPQSSSLATDVAAAAAKAFSGRRFAVRVTEELLGPSASEPLQEVLASEGMHHWRDLRDAVCRLDLPQSVKEDLASLDGAKVRGRNERVVAYTDVYGTDEQGRPRGVVFVAPFGVEGGKLAEDGRGGATEDDVAGSMQGVAVPLQAHCSRVEAVAEDCARRIGLPEALIGDLRLAAYLHDAGKADPRFQALLAYSDPLGPDPLHVLAKSARYAPRNAKGRVGLPKDWRHEALSVRLAPLHPRFREADDAGLVLWLIGAHHGWGRPFFPHNDPTDGEAREDLPPVLGSRILLTKDSGPESLAYCWNGFDWPSLFEHLKARYGMWELARLEAIVRLADHRVSEAEQEGVKGGTA
ncbi:MAG: type I-U CRISPR-associated helicase/endonuclease Cas3 [Thermaerobacter sp.]|nr:type I-U CRISPR-associated helicase/endonuclease Cas3 [Thermaerobacter sp.]